MITHSALTLLYNYHYWITARLLEACEALTPEQWHKSLGHSWDSAQGVAAHMLAAEAIWLARWKGISPTTLLEPAAVPTLADLQREWDKVEADLRGFLNECSDAQLAADLTYTNTKGQTFTVPLGALMLHVANHGTHHRGELVAMLAMLDVPHPQDDLLWYLLEQRQP